MRYAYDKEKAIAFMMWGRLLYKKSKYIGAVSTPQAEIIILLERAQALCLESLNCANDFADALFYLVRSHSGIFLTVLG